MINTEDFGNGHVSVCFNGGYIDIWGDGSIGIQNRHGYASVSDDYDEFVDQLLAAIAKRKRRDGKPQQWPKAESSEDEKDYTYLVTKPGAEAYLDEIDTSYSHREFSVEVAADYVKARTAEARNIYRLVAKVGPEPQREREVTIFG